MGYTWAQFNDEVRKELPIDSDRLGAEQFIPRQIRNSVLDLQGFVKRYQKGHESSYTEANLTRHGSASFGALVEDARFVEAWITRSRPGTVTESLGPELAEGKTYTGGTLTVAVQQGLTYRYTLGANDTSLQNGVTAVSASGDFIAEGGTVVLSGSISAPVTATLQRVIKDSGCICTKHPIHCLAWDVRHELVSGQYCIHDNHGVMAIDPEGKVFYAYPQILSKETIDEEDYSYCLTVRWDGKRLDFGDLDPVPFDESMVKAVAMYVKAELAREVEKDLSMSRSYREDYATARLNLYLNR